ncbi:hypothetical protein INR49_022589 [Caranx melampygus]|nr:hypothetical protein INR49_022589 [Caranx melampygus]
MFHYQNIGRSLSLITAVCHSQGGGGGGGGGGWRPPLEMDIRKEQRAGMMMMMMMMVVVVGWRDAWSWESLWDQDLATAPESLSSRRVAPPARCERQ